MSIPEAVATVRDRIDCATSACSRTDPVHLELTVKTRTPEECRATAVTLYEVSLPILLSHSQVQETHATAEAIREVPDARIHLIGPLQSNKASRVLVCVDAIESLDLPALTSKIDARTTGTLPVFVEVNASDETTKHGCVPTDVNALVDVIGVSAHLQLAGFMTVGLSSPVEADVHVACTQLRGIRDEVAACPGINGSDLALSMGVSHDLKRVIAGGAMIVRLGTTVFGARRV